MDITTIDRVLTPKGRSVTLAYREGTTDLGTIAATFEVWGHRTNEYRLVEQPPMSGWAIDIGAHCGTVSLALALDNPDLRVLAVEALPENCEVIRESVRINGLEDRVTVVNAAADARNSKRKPVAYNWTSAEGMDDSYVVNSRFIGGMLDDPSGDYAYPPGVSLSGLMKTYQINLVRYLKIDCEGCEWAFLTDPRVADVQEIIGEYHFGGRMEAVHNLLDRTHEVEFLEGEDTIGLFRAVAK